MLNILINIFLFISIIFFIANRFDFLEMDLET